MGTLRKYVTNGTDLAEALSLPVAEGRFHVDGEFYELPREYPCAFFDKRGYFIIDSESLLHAVATISKGKVNLRHPISKQRNYHRSENAQDWPTLAAAHSEKKSKMMRTKKLLATLTDKERQQLIKSLKSASK